MMIRLRRAFRALVSFVGGPQQRKRVSLGFAERQAHTNVLVAHAVILNARSQRRNRPLVLSFAGG